MQQYNRNTGFTILVFLKNIELKIVGIIANRTITYIYCSLSEMCSLNTNFTTSFPTSSLNIANSPHDIPIQISEIRDSTLYYETFV